MTPRRWSKLTRVWAYLYLCSRDGEQCARCGKVPGPSPSSDQTVTARNTLDIDHIDGNPSNTNPTNLRLLCRKCNVTVYHRNKNGHRTVTARNPYDVHSMTTPNAPLGKRPNSLRSDLCVCVCEDENGGKPRSGSDSGCKCGAEHEGHVGTETAGENDVHSQEGHPATGIVKQDCNHREATPEMQANSLFEVPFRAWLLQTVMAQGGYDRTTAINEGAEQVGCSPATTARYLAKLTSPSGPLVETTDALGHKMLVLKEHLHL